MNYRKPFVFAAACLGMLMFGVSLLSMGTLLPDIIARFQLDGLASGALVSILPFGVLAGSLVFGPVVDRFGYKLLLALSALVVIGGLELLAFAWNVGALRVAIFAIGFGGGVLNGGTNALVADISVGERGAKLSLLGVFFGVGALGMPVLLGVMRGFAPALVLAGIGAVLALPVLWFAFIAFPVPKQAQGFPIAQGLGLVRDGTLVAIALTLALQSGIEGVVNNWSTTYLQHARGIGAAPALLALSAYVGGMTMARLVLAAVLRAAPGARVLVIGIACSLLGILVMALSAGAVGAAAGLALVGAGLAAAFPLLMSFVADLYPAISGTAFSVVLVVALAGNMALNYAMGALTASYGVRALPAYLAACLAVQLGLLAVALRAYAARTRAAVRTA